MDWFMMGLKKYAQFEGRARRSEYWYFHLIHVVVVLVLAIPAVALMAVGASGHSSVLTGVGVVLYIGIFAFILATLLPSIAVLVRRLHDTGRSGWWYFISLVPFVGPIVLLVFLFTDSQPGDNMYGPNPKGIGTAPWGMASYPPAQI